MEHNSLPSLTFTSTCRLSLCKNVLALLGGDISLDDTYDSGLPGCPGARFVVKLNNLLLGGSAALDPPGCGAPDTSPENTAAGSSWAAQIDSRGSTLPETLSVLFVDDDAMLRKLFMRSLRKVHPNWTIEGASSGESALEKVIGGTNGEPRDVESQLGEVHGHYDLIFGKHMSVFRTHCSACIFRS